VVGATLPPERLDEALTGLLDEAFRLAVEEVGVEELEKAKTIVESDAIYQKETVQGMARKLGFYETVAGSLAHEDEYVRQTRELTPGALRAVVRRYLRFENLTVSALLPAAQAKGQEKRLAAHLLERAGATRMARAEEKPAAPVARRGAARDEEKVVREVLPSGTRVLVLPDRSVPLVSIRAAWIGGLRDEQADNNGVNNLTSMLITRGTRTRTAEQVAHEIESLAGSIGGFSGRNSFGIRAELLARHVERGFDVLADCLLHPSFADEELDKERHQVLEEIRTQEDNVSSVVFRLFSQTLYRTHPYRMDVLGTPESLARLNRRRVLDYYRRHFPPSRMAIAIVGDVDPDAMVAMVRENFESPAQSVFARAAGEPGDESERRRAVPPDEPVHEPRRAERILNKQQAHLVIGFPGSTIGDEDRFTLEVLATLLSGQGGRLFVELREKRGLAYRVSAFTLEGIDPGYFAVYVATSPENLKTVESGILEELAKVRDRPVGRAELERAKRYLVGSHDISLQRRSALAATLSFNECYGLGWDQYRKYGPGILAVSVDEVQRIARKYLDPRRAVTAVVRPEEVAAAERGRVAEAARAPRANKPAERRK
jgi:zinc protease